MHRFDDLPTGTQPQTKVGAGRKLLPLNGGIDKRQITKKQLKNKLAKQNTPHGNKPAKPKCTVLTTYRKNTTANKSRRSKEVTALKRGNKNKLQKRL